MVKIKKKHSKDYRFWSMCWRHKAIKLHHLHDATFYNSITKEEYKMICGLNYEDYVAPAEDEDEADEYEVEVEE